MRSLKKMIKEKVKYSDVSNDSVCKNDVISGIKNVKIKLSR